jgi:hypothetical protein
MKHLLNDLSEQEKNSIREQHTGGMKVMTEGFSKLINSKLGNSKPLVFEQVEEMDEQAAALTPNVKRLVDDIKNNRLTVSDLHSALMFLKDPKQKPVQKTVSQPSTPQSQPVQKAATTAQPSTTFRGRDYSTSTSVVR